MTTDNSYALSATQNLATQPEDADGIIILTGPTEAPQTRGFKNFSEDVGAASGLAAAAREGIYELSSNTDNDIADTLRLTERNSSIIKEGVKYYVSGGDAGGLRGKTIRRNGTALPSSVSEAAFRANFETYWETISGVTADEVIERVLIEHNHWSGTVAQSDLITSRSEAMRMVPDDALWALGYDLEVEASIELTSASHDLYRVELHVGTTKLWGLENPALRGVKRIGHVVDLPRPYPPSDNRLILTLTSSTAGAVNVAGARFELRPKRRVQWDRVVGSPLEREIDALREKTHEIDDGAPKTWQNVTDNAADGGLVLIDNNSGNANRTLQQLVALFSGDGASTITVVSGQAATLGLRIPVGRSITEYGVSDESDLSWIHRGNDSGWSYYLVYLHEPSSATAQLQRTQQHHTWYGHTIKEQILNADGTPATFGGGGSAGDGEFSLTLLGTSATLTSTAANIPKVGGGNVTRADLGDVFYVDLSYTRQNADLRMSGMVLKSDLAGTAEYRFQAQGVGGDYLAFAFDGAGDTANLTALEASNSLSNVVVRVYNIVAQGEKGDKGDKGDPGSGAVNFEDEGTAINGISIVNFIGAGVTAAVNGTDATQLDVTIAGSSSSGGGATSTFLAPDADSQRASTDSTELGYIVWSSLSDFNDYNTGNLSSISSPSAGDIAFALIGAAFSTRIITYGWYYTGSFWLRDYRGNVAAETTDTIGSDPVSSEDDESGDAVTTWSADRSWAEGALTLYGLSIWEALEDIAANQAAPGDHHLWAAVTPLISGIDDASSANLHAALRVDHGGIVEDIVLDPSPAIQVGNIERPIGAEFPNDMSIDWDNGRIVTPTDIATDLEFDEQPDHIVVEVQAVIAGGGGKAPTVRLVLYDEDGVQASNFEMLNPDDKVRYYEFEIERDSDTYTLAAENVTDGSDSGLITLHSIDILGFTGTSKAARLIAMISDKLDNLDKENIVSLTTQDVIDQINALVPPAQRVPALTDHGGEAVTVKADESGLEFEAIPSNDQLARVTQGIELATGGSWERVTNADDIAWATYTGIPTLDQAKALTFGTDTIFVPDAHMVVTRIRRARNSHQVRINYTARTPGGESGTYAVNGGLLAGTDGGYDYWYKELIFSHAGFDVYGEYNAATDLWLGGLTQSAVYAALKDILKGAGAVLDDAAETITIA